MTPPRIAVLLPCYNEEAAIGQTVAGFRAALPTATIYVYDNNSRDRTVEVAAAAAVLYVRSRRQYAMTDSAGDQGSVDNRR